MTSNLREKTTTSYLALVGKLARTRDDCPFEIVPRRDWRDKDEQDNQKYCRNARNWNVKQRKEDQERMRREECVANLYRRVPMQRKVQPAMVHTSEHLALVKQRRLLQEKLRNEQLLHEQNLKNHHQCARQPRNNVLLQESQKLHKAKESRRILIDTRQKQVEYELKNKEFNTKCRLKVKETHQNSKCKNLIEKNRILQERNKQKRIEIEQQNQEIKENQVALKEFRANKILGIQRQPEFKRKNYNPDRDVPDLREFLTTLRKLLFEITHEEETSIDYGFGDDNYIEEKRRTVDWIKSGFDDRILEPDFDDYSVNTISNNNDNKRNCYIAPMSEILQDLNIDCDANHISKQLMIYADYLLDLNKSAKCAGDLVDWSKWQDEVRNRVRAIPDWQVRSLEQNRMQHAHIHDQFLTNK